MLFWSWMLAQHTRISTVSFSPVGASAALRASFLLSNSERDSQRLSSFPWKTQRRISMSASISSRDSTCFRKFFVGAALEQNEWFSFIFPLNPREPSNRPPALVSQSQSWPKRAGSFLHAGATSVSRAAIAQPRDPAIHFGCGSKFKS